MTSADVVASFDRYKRVGWEKATLTNVAIVGGECIRARRSTFVDGAEGGRSRPSWRN